MSIGLCAFYLEALLITFSFHHLKTHRALLEVFLLVCYAPYDSLTITYYTTCIMRQFYSKAFTAVYRVCCTDCTVQHPLWTQTMKFLPTSMTSLYSTTSNLPAVLDPLTWSLKT